jgi:hypothetical protein
MFLDIFSHFAMFQVCAPKRGLDRLAVRDAERGIGKKTPIFSAAVGRSSAITVFRRTAAQVSKRFHQRPPSSCPHPRSRHPVGPLLHKQ